ncbi:MAG: OmpA family protein [Prevotella sp.]|nr:OmpA family protein [Prevotella sp.]
MKIKKIILSCLLVMGCLGAAAQPEEKTEYVFNPHWYLQVQPLGAQYTVGELSFGKLVSYNAQIGAGYQFNPTIGLRLSVNAWSSRAGWEMDNTIKKWRWNYVAPMLDATVNVSNLFCGFNPKRVFEFSVFGGIGMNIGWGNDEAANAAEYINTTYYSGATQDLSYLWDGTKVRLAGRVGVMADFRICDAVTLGLEASANVLNDHYNSKKAGNADWYINALVGVKINLGKTYTTKKITPPAPPEKVVERVVEKVVEKPAPPAPPVVEKVEPLRRDIFFTINATHIVGTEAAKVKEVAEYLKKYPEATVQVTGYADKGTGNEKINQALSEKRAQAVVDSLINDYGISSSRIFSSAKGDTEQPFDVDTQNRVSICIAK